VDLRDIDANSSGSEVEESTTIPVRNLKLGFGALGNVCP
jgi:hypothetical protein